MFSHLRIYDPHERWLVGLADLSLATVSAVTRLWPRQQATRTVPRRILLLRLERIGDLLMTLGAIAAVRELAREAEIDLVVGSWNASVASLIREVDQVETFDAPWLAGETSGLPSATLLRRALAWRARHYDLAINFEGDIRSNILMALSGARQRVGFAMAGGGALLTDPVEHDPGLHTAVNARRLVSRALELGDSARNGNAAVNASLPRLNLPDDARRRARQLLSGAGTGSLLVGIQASAGRAIKQWDPARMAEVGARLVRERGATLVLTGAAGDKSLLDQVKAALPPDVPSVELSGETDLIVLAAVLEQLALFITCDTGPMHLAAAVGTPIVAIFGPSLPPRYAPLSTRAKIVRIDIWCSPCNRLRRPPSRCIGHIPDCLTGIESGAVLEAALELLDATGAR